MTDLCDHDCLRGPNSKRFNVWTDSTLLIVQQNSSQRGSMLALIQHSQVSDQCSNWRPPNSWTSSTQELHHKRNLQTVGQLRGQWIFYFNYKHYGRPDLKCGLHPQVKLIGRCFTTGFECPTFFEVTGSQNGLYQ